MKTNPGLGYLQFIARWEREEEEAAEASVRLRKAAPTYAELRAIAPDGSRDWALFLRHFASFEDAATQVRAGNMREDLFFEGWWALPKAWDNVKQYVAGLRAEE